jgi:hypothetical protein
MRAVFIVIFSFWFLLGSFMPGNDAEELAKIPFLVAHFEEHSREGGVQDFISFIREHYDSSMPDGHDHQQLPFAKHLQPCLLFVLPSFVISINPVLSELCIEAVFPEVPSTILDGFAETWQPPRLGLAIYSVALRAFCAHFSLYFMTKLP